VSRYSRCNSTLSRLALPPRQRGPASTFIWPNQGLRFPDRSCCCCLPGSGTRQTSACALPAGVSGRCGSAVGGPFDRQVRCAFSLRRPCRTDVERERADAFRRTDRCRLSSPSTCWCGPAAARCWSAAGLSFTWPQCPTCAGRTGRPVGGRLQSWRLQPLHTYFGGSLVVLSLPLPCAPVCRGRRLRESPRARTLSGAVLGAVATLCPYSRAQSGWRPALLTRSWTFSSMLRLLPPLSLFGAHGGAVISRLSAPSLEALG